MNTLCEPVPERIVWLYKRWQPLYDEISRTVVVGFPVQSLPLINSSLSFTEMKQTKNVIVLKTTNSQTVVLQSDFQLIKFKGFCLVAYPMKDKWECALSNVSFVPAFETPTRRVYVCGDFVGNFSYVRNSYQPVVLERVFTANEHVKLLHGFMDHDGFPPSYKRR
jgi:hypothetical protein